MNLEIKDGILLGSKEEIRGELVVPDGVKEIAAHAFRDNLGITSVVFPPSLERIGTKAFSGCCNLRKAIIPENTRIGKNAFKTCIFVSNLPVRQWKKRYGISELVYALHYILFCQSAPPFEEYGSFSDPLKEETLKAENNKYIKRSLARIMDMYPELSAHVINYVVREIPLDIDTVDELLDKFGGNVETNTVLLDYRHNHFSAEFLEKYAAEQTEKELGLRPRTVDDWKKIYDLSDDGQGGVVIRKFKYKGKDTDIVIPDTIGEQRVTAIGKYAFRPPTGRHGEPLDNIPKLHTVYIPESVTQIDEYAFDQCLDLEEIEISDSVISIEDGAFYCCLKLKKLRLPMGLTYIADNLFLSCESLSEIEIPSSVTSIGISAFYNCKSLNSVTIPDGVKHIGHSAFSHCSGLTEITLPGSLTEIEKSLFAACDNLTKAVIEKGITAIPADMFTFCRNLAEVRLPDGIVSLGRYAFHDCGALRRIILPPTVRDISNAFNECWGLEELEIPEGVTIIAAGAFYKAGRLKKITLPRTITQIWEAAFEQSGITSIKIPSGVTAIRANTFWCCDDLDEVEIPASVTEINPGAFYLASKNMVISAPCGSYAIEYAKKKGINFKELPI